jgi:hypothetical protein
MNDGKWQMENGKWQMEEGRSRLSLHLPFTI